ncbi:MAG: hypothetical protein AB1756_04225 [Acidobacteriota bacterium]
MHWVLSIIITSLLISCQTPTYPQSCDNLDAETKKALNYFINNVYGLGLVRSEDNEELDWARRTLLQRGKEVLPCLVEIFNHGLQNSKLWPLKTKAPSQGRWVIDLIREIDVRTASGLYREWRVEPDTDYLTKIHISTELASIGDLEFLPEVVNFLMNPPAVPATNIQRVRSIQERAIEVISICNYRPALAALQNLASEKGPNYAKYWRWLPIYIAQLSEDEKTLLRYARDSENFGWALRALKRMGKIETLKALAADYNYKYRDLAKTLLETNNTPY